MEFLKFIGTGSFNNYVLGNNSAFFVRDNNIFVFDCGASTFHTIVEDYDAIFRDADNIYIFITHTHDDHVGSLASLLFHSFYIWKKRAILVTNNQSEMIGMLNSSMGEVTKFAKLKSTNRHGWVMLNFKESSVRIRYIRTKHVDYLRSFGFYVSIKEKDDSIVNFYYSGDSHTIPNFILREFLDGNLSKLYHDVTFVDYPENPHMSIYKLEELIPEEHRHRVYLMHREEDFDINYALMRGFQLVFPYRGI